MGETNSSDCSAQGTITFLGYFIIALTYNWLHNHDMNRDEQILRKKYHQFRNYREKRCKEQFEITAEEWIAFFLRTPAHYETLAVAFGTSCISKADTEASWSVDNLVIGQRTKTQRKPASHALLGDTAIAERFNRHNVRDGNTGVRVLTKAQWIAELRGSTRPE
ncbi:hypothetical protein [Agrobacterium rosae]|uniref:hypothetical protein n=1 Tax=Agrobacterium rosae TaxID=1972867 RepID=UPI0011AF9154|nr:hypothetical protein [Agrobacterium rosae]